MQPDQRWVGRTCLAFGRSVKNRSWPARVAMSRLALPGAGILARAVSSNGFLASTPSLAALLWVAHVLVLRPVPRFGGLILDS